MEDLTDTEEEDSFPLIKATKEGNTVRVESLPNVESYNDIKMMLGAIEYNFIFKVEGEVVSQNASSYDESTKTATWTLGDMLQNGISLVYDTESKGIENIVSIDSRGFKLLIVITSIVAVVVTFIIFLFRKK